MDVKKHRKVVSVVAASNEKCDKCENFAGFETSPEGQMCGVCETWVCNDCCDNQVNLMKFVLPDGREISEDVICKDCSKELKLRELKPVEVY